MAEGMVQEILMKEVKTATVLLIVAYYRISITINKF